ncbi:MAG: hypothetical protein MJ110_07070 [Lachnospiraceae bacterium]|nr:hypothetical protein [Lachnospiraceae bacterium]
MIRTFPKYSIIVVSEEVHFVRAYYRVILVKNRKRKTYREIYCLPKRGYKARKIISREDIENSIAELLALEGFDYWIHYLFS